jgi:hypothetical protein
VIWSAFRYIPPNTAKISGFHLEDTKTIRNKSTESARGFSMTIRRIKKHLNEVGSQLEAML